MTKTLGREKISFLNTPTPLHRLDRISEDLGVEFYMKRDDLTNFGTGGNKLRKLEYFVKDALDQGATMLLTVGGAQTNHGRLTAAVAAKFGLKSAIVAVDPYPGEISANLLLDGIMDCHVYLVQEPSGQGGSSSDGQDAGDPDEHGPGASSSDRQDDGGSNEMALLDEAVEKITREWESKGEKVYFIPMGGSNELGALGYYDCALELAEQVDMMELEDPRVVVTIGSLGTYTGLAAAIANERLPLRLTGVGILPYRDLNASAAKHYEKMRKAYDLRCRLASCDFDVTSDYDYGDYNNPVADVRKAIYYMGKMEGIILDPCYTGKTFNAIKKMIDKGEISKGETLIMIHTGGVPGIYTLHHRIEMEKELADHIHIL